MGQGENQAEFERRWLARQDAPMWPLDQLVLCKQALNPIYWQLRLEELSKALAMDQESLSGGFMGKDQEN